MSADEIFEKLGFEKIDRPVIARSQIKEQIISYTNRQEIRGCAYIMSINFYMMSKLVSITANKILNGTPMPKNLTPAINAKVARAINQKCEELRWIE